jgi:arabinan endo-1,5-alpha-L-arabinosidase
MHRTGGVRRLLSALMVAIVVGGGATSDAAFSSAAVLPQGCVLMAAGNLDISAGSGTVGSSCSFTATHVETFTGSGPFDIRDTYRLTNGAVVVRFDVTEPAGAISLPADSLADPYKIDIGDTVSAVVTGVGGLLIIGNPGALPGSGTHTPPPAPPLSGDVTPVHDPNMVYSHGWYYLFVTGSGIPIRRSSDLVHWEPYGQVFADNMPPWATQVIPGATSPWAPDVAYFDGLWHLYYAISVFGTDHSAIGLAVNDTLDESSPRYGWHDEGPIIESGSSATTAVPLGVDNAIDPSIVFDAVGVPHLEFGSFSGGLMLLNIDPSTGRPLLPMVPVPLAANPGEFTAVEGGFMIRHEGWYYLFGSYDFCCQGTSSDYNVRVGRSRSITGPFVDDLGIPMLLGGGRYVLTSNGNMRGPGGEGVIAVDGADDIYFHYYDAANKGVPTLGILRMDWTSDGWPIAVVP